MPTGDCEFAIDLEVGVAEQLNVDCDGAGLEDRAGLGLRPVEQSEFIKRGGVDPAAHDLRLLGDLAFQTADLGNVDADPRNRRMTHASRLDGSGMHDGLLGLTAPYTDRAKVRAGGRFGDMDLCIGGLLARQRLIGAFQHGRQSLGPACGFVEPRQLRLYLEHKSFGFGMARLRRRKPDLRGLQRLRSALWHIWWLRPRRQAGARRRPIYNRHATRWLTPPRH